MPQEAAIWMWSVAQPHADDIHLLSPADIARYQVMRHPDAARRFVASRAGMRRYLSGWLQVDAAGICIEGGGDRPLVLPDFPQVHISLSHSGDSVVLAVAPQPIGVDVESHKPRRNLREFSRRVFDPREAAWVVDTHDETQVQDRFYGLWTLKESALKQQGKGMSYPCRQPAFVDERDGTLQAVGMPGIGQCWRVGDLWISVTGVTIPRLSGGKMLWKLRPDP